MPVKWRPGSLGDVAHVEMGQSPPSEHVAEGADSGLAFLQGNAEFTNLHPRPRLRCTKPLKTAKAGDTLISVRAPVGAINRADRPYCIGRGLAAVRFGGIDPNFGYQALGLRAGSLQRVAQGTTFEAVGGRELRQLDFPTPPLPEQRRIAEILDTLDEAIRKTEQVIAKLQQMKQGLLHDLLSRGIDEHGELRDPERHPEQFKDSPLGRIPKGWEVRPLGEIVTSAVDGPFGSSLKSSHYVEAGVRVVRLQNISPGYFDDRDRAFVSAQHAATLSRHEVASGDLLVASLGDENHPIARACLYPDNLPPGIVKADCFRLRLARDAHAAGFVMMALNCPSTRIDVPSLSQGVTRDRINLGNLMRIRLPVPPAVEQRSAYRQVLGVERRLLEEGEHADKLRTLKRGLMDDLLTGRVRVTTSPESTP